MLYAYSCGSSFTHDGCCMAQSVFVDMTSPPLGCNTELSYQHSSVEGVKATQDRAVYLKCQQFINGALEAIFIIICQ